MIHVARLIALGKRVVRHPAQETKVDPVPGQPCLRFRAMPFQAVGHDSPYRERRNPPGADVRQKIDIGGVVFIFVAFQ